MSMVAVKAHERRKPVNVKQEALHEQLRSELAWDKLENFTAERLPALVQKPLQPREGDPFPAVRSMFSHMPAFASGRAMASHIVADTRMDLIDMEAVIAEALADNEFMQMAEGFPLDGGLLNL